ncbi:MAG TPA: hypothetical protein VF133_05245 [Terriglobales bacterium]|jgi:hypothetical protein
MKVHIIRDEHGKVVATYENNAPGGPQLKPVLKPGHTVHEINASDDYTKDIRGFYRQHSQK